MPLEPTSQNGYEGKTRCRYTYFPTCKGLCQNNSLFSVKPLLVMLFMTKLLLILYLCHISLGSLIFMTNNTNMGIKHKQHHNYFSQRGTWRVIWVWGQERPQKDFHSTMNPWVTLIELTKLISPPIKTTSRRSCLYTIVVSTATWVNEASHDILVNVASATVHCVSSSHTHTQKRLNFS